MYKAIFRKRIVLFLTAVVTFSLSLGLTKLQPNQRLQDFQLYASNIKMTRVDPLIRWSFPSPMEPREIGDGVSELVFRLMFCQLPVEVFTLENQIVSFSLLEYPLAKSNLLPSSQSECT